MELNQYRVSSRRSRPSRILGLLACLTHSRSGFAIPQAEIVERKAAKHTHLGVVEHASSKRKITMLVLHRSRRVSETEPKHTTRHPSPGTHGGVAQDRPVRRERAIAPPFYGPGDVKIDACDRHTLRILIGRPRSRRCIHATCVGQGISGPRKARFPVQKRRPGRHLGLFFARRTG